MAAPPPLPVPATGPLPNVARRNRGAPARGAGPPASASGSPLAGRPSGAGGAPPAADVPAVAPTPEELDAPAVPPSVTTGAFLQEVRSAGKEQRASRQRNEEERARLEKLAKEIAEARAALRAETERLEALTRKGAERPRPATRPAPADGATPTGPARSPYDGLAKTVKGMRPERAAEVVARLDRPLAVELLRQIRPADVAAILEKLKPEAAADLLARMALAAGDAP